MDENRPLAIQDKVLYNRSKALAETAALEAARTGQDVVILNPTAVIGPYDFAPSLMGKALILIYRQKLPVLIQGGYDWVDARDVAEAAAAAVKKGRSGQRYLLSGRWQSLMGLSRMIADLTQRKPPRLACPPAVALASLPLLRFYCRLSKSEPLYTKDSLRILHVAHQHISHTKAQEELGFHPRPLEETIKDTLNWFIEHEYI